MQSWILIEIFFICVSWSFRTIDQDSSYYWLVYGYQWYTLYLIKHFCSVYLKLIGPSCTLPVLDVLYSSIKCQVRRKDIKVKLSLLVYEIFSSLKEWNIELRFWIVSFDHYTLFIISLYSYFNNMKFSLFLNNPSFNINYQYIFRISLFSLIPLYKTYFDIYFLNLSFFNNDLSYWK